MKKRVLAVVLSLTLIIGVLSAPVMAEEKFSFNFDFLKQLTSEKESDAAEKEDTSPEKQAEDTNDVTIESNEIINTQGATVARVLTDDAQDFVCFDTVQGAINYAVTGITEPAQARTVVLYRSSPSEEIITLDEPLTIKENEIVILDLSNYTLNAQNKCSVIQNAGTLTIKNSYTNQEDKGVICGGSAENGGGIYNTGKLTITYANIKNNNAANGGAGIYNCGTLTIDGGVKRNVTFSNNSSQNGGAIYNASGSIATIKNAKFSENTANYAGGAIFNNQSTLTLENCEITKCTAGYYGGAIYNSSTEQSDGSGIIPSNTTLKNGTTLNECGFTNNPGDDKMGGAVFNRGILTMEEGSVIKNCSADKGAGVHNHGATYVKFDMNGGKIINNTAQKNGGGVQNSENATFNFNGGEISGNTATTSYGGGIFTKGNLAISGTVYLYDNTGNSTVSNLAVVKNHPIAFGDDLSGMVGLSLIEKQAGSYVNNLTGDVTSNGDADDLEHLFADQSSTQKLECKNEKIELVATGQCRAEEYTVSLDGIVAGKEYDLYLGDQQQVGKYLFEKIGSEWYIKQKDDPSSKYLNYKNGKVVKELNRETAWKYDGGFYQEIETTQKFLWWDITKKTNYYLASTNEGAELTTSKVKATIKSSNPSVDEHPCRYTNITNTTHTAICQICGKTSVDGHSYDKDTHKCVCGKYHPDYAVTKIEAYPMYDYISFLFLINVNYCYSLSDIQIVLPQGNDNAVEKITYSTNGGNTWKTVEDNMITIKSFFQPISSVNILFKVKTTDGTTSLWNGICPNPERKPEMIYTRINYYGD